MRSWRRSAGARLPPASRSPARLREPPHLIRLLIGLGCLIVAITPLQVAVSQGRLDEAVAAYRARDFATAIDRALASLEAVGVRPQARQALAYCDLRLRRPDLALRQLDAALKRDPDNWELHYARAIVLAAGA